MKRDLFCIGIFGTVSLISLSAAAQSGLYGSFYDAPVTTTQGVRLIQETDADGRGQGRYHWVPSQYRLRSANSPDGGVAPVYSHSIVRGRDGKEVSVYDFDLLPSSVSDIQVQRLEQGLGGQVVSRARACGVSMNIPGYLAVAESVSSGIRAFLNIPTENSVGCLGNAPLVDRVNLRLEVPMNQEPYVARALTGDVGLILPEVVWSLPIRYHDRARVEVNYEQTYESLSQAFSGDLGVYFVSADIGHQVRRIVADGSLGVRVHVDVQTPGAADRIREFAVETVLREFLRLVPEGVPGVEGSSTPNRGTGGVGGRPNGVFSSSNSGNRATTPGRSDGGGSRRVQPAIATGATGATAGNGQSGAIPVAGDNDPLPEEQQSNRRTRDNSGVRPDSFIQAGNFGSSGRAQVNPNSMIRLGVGFKMDRVEARSRGTQTFDYQQTNYSQMRAEIPIRIKQLSPVNLDPALRALLERE